jgi:hypothetical protein
LKNPINFNDSRLLLYEYKMEGIVAASFHAVLCPSLALPMPMLTDPHPHPHLHQGETMRMGNRRRGNFHSSPHHVAMVPVVEAAAHVAVHLALAECQYV